MRPALPLITDVLALRSLQAAVFQRPEICPSEMRPNVRSPEGATGIGEGFVGASSACAPSGHYAIYPMPRVNPGLSFPGPSGQRHDFSYIRAFGKCPNSRAQALREFSAHQVGLQVCWSAESPLLDCSNKVRQ